MPMRRGAGAVERGGLENRCTRERTVGSNPTLSAIAAVSDPDIWGAVCVRSGQIR